MRKGRSPPTPCANLHTNQAHGQASEANEAMQLDAIIVRPTLKHRTHPPTHPPPLAPSPQQMPHHSDAVGAGDGAEPLARTVLPGMGLRGGLGCVLGCCRPLNQLRHQGTTLQAKQQQNTRKGGGADRPVALVPVNNCMVAAGTLSDSSPCTWGYLVRAGQHAPAHGCTTTRR